MFDSFDPFLESLSIFLNIGSLAIMLGLFLALLLGLLIYLAFQVIQFVKARQVIKQRALTKEALVLAQGEFDERSQTAQRYSAVTSFIERKLQQRQLWWRRPFSRRNVGKFQGEIIEISTESWCQAAGEQGRFTKHALNRGTEVVRLQDLLRQEEEHLESLRHPRKVSEGR